MKTRNLFIILLIVLTSTINAQITIDLSNLTENITLGNNCSSSQYPEEFETIGDVNLNGFELHLKNANLRINGNLNGPGEITHCNNDNSHLCITGFTNNNPNLSNLQCIVLSIERFELIPQNYFLNYKIYNLTGKLLLEGKTNENFYNDLPKDQILIIKVDKFKAFKLWLK